MITCAKGNTSLVFDDRNGQIQSLKNEDMEYISGAIPVLSCSVRDRSGKQFKFDLTEFRHLDTVCEENSFYANYETDMIQVKIGAELGEEIVWSLEMNVTDGVVSEWVNYPCITVPNTLSKENEGHKLLWGYNEGVLVETLEDREKTYSYIEPDYPTKGLTGLYPGAVETQFMAYYNKDGGFYFGAHDRGDCFKGIDFYRHENGGIYLQFRHLCGVDFGENYQMKYPMVMRFFKGDWHDAADIYKEWFEQSHSWIPIEKDESLPSWYHQSPVIVAYPVRGSHDTDSMEPNKLFPYVNILPHIERLEREFESPVMALLMHWEGTVPWAPPIVWPPFGGEETLSELITKLHDRGDVIGLYCSGIGWTINSKLADYHTQEYFNDHHLQHEMCVSPTGELLYSNICNGQRDGYDLCPAKEYTVQTMAEQVKRMADAGVDYIQLLDQNHGGTPYFCYSREHGHPPVPGKWEVDAMKKLLQTVKKDAKDALLGCESAAAEGYIPYLKFSDNRFNINYLIGTPIPLYAYLYHRYVNNFMGNQVFANGQINLAKSPDNNLERTAYAFCAGDMLTVVLDQDGEITWNWGAKPADGIPQQQPIKTLVKNLNRWRRGETAKYLHTGSMKKPYEVICEEAVLERNFVDSKLFVPKILTSAWESSEKEFGQFLVNYQREPVTCTVCLPEREFTATLQNGEVRIVSGNATLEIPPLSAVLIEGEQDA